MLGQNMELERLLALARNPQQEWRQRQEATDKTSVGLKPMGTRGPSGSDESSKLCRCAVLVPPPPRAMNLSWRPQALACGDMWGHARAESQSQMLEKHW